MANPIESQIKDRIQAFVNELDALVRRNTLDALRSVLDGSAAPARRGARRGAGGARGRGRASGNDEGVASAITAHVRANDGQTVGEICKAIGASPQAAKKAIVKLLAAGALKKTGQKRGTRYHVGSGSAPARRGKRRGRKGRKSKAA